MTVLLNYSVQSLIVLMIATSISLSPLSSKFCKTVSISHPFRNKILLKIDSKLSMENYQYNVKSFCCQRETYFQHTKTSIYHQTHRFFLAAGTPKATEIPAEITKTNKREFSTRTTIASESCTNKRKIPIKDHNRPSAPSLLYQFT
jgi:hypothetical protein